MMSRVHCARSIVKCIAGVLCTNHFDAMLLGVADKATTSLGPAGERVSRNIKRLRESGRLTFVELSDRLAKIGRPIPVLGLRRIERGERRVDVDDLFAFAEVFEVSPLMLAAQHDVEGDLASARALLNEAALMIAPATGGDDFLRRLLESGHLTKSQADMVVTVRSASRAGVFEALQRDADRRQGRRAAEGDGE